MKDDVIIRVHDLTKAYKLYEKPINRLKESLHPFRKIYHKDFYALNDISFEVKKGETVGLIGKNGSGKSTLLKIMTGVLTPTSGEIQVNGKVAALLELGAGFNPEMTGLENIYLNGTIMGFTREEIDKRVEDILAFADIGEFVYQPVKTYSSGMFARLAFSVAVNVEPDILIVDEALSVGDIFFQQKCTHKMKKMQQNGVTIFFVSHALGNVKTLCSKVIYLREGKMVSIGDPESVCNMYQNELTMHGSTAKHLALKDAEESILNMQLGTLQLKNGAEKYFRIDPEMERRLTERSGGGEIYFTAIDIYDENDNKVQRIRTGKVFTARISFVTHENIPEGAALGLLCRNEHGVDIFGCNSNYYSLSFPELRKGGKYVYEMDIKNPLLTGRYIFHLGIKPEPYSSYYYDRCFTANILEVDPPDFLVEQPHGGIIMVNPIRIQLKFKDNKG